MAVKQKAATAKKAAKGETADLIAKAVQEAQKIEEEAVHALVAELIADEGHSTFRLGALLSRVQGEEWFGEHESFKDYVEVEHGFSYRKAAYLVSSYEACVAADVKWFEVEGIGWAKLKEIASVITPKNKAKWLKLAESLTLSELTEKVRASKKGRKGDGEADSDTTADVTPLKFLMHEDALGTVQQALTKAKQEGGTEHDNVALEYVAAAYLSAGDAKKPTVASMVAIFKKSKIEDVLAAVEKAFPNVSLTAEIDEDADADEAAEEPAKAETPAPAKKAAKVAPKPAAKSDGKTAEDFADEDADDFEEEEEEEE